VDDERRGAAALVELGFEFAERGVGSVGPAGAVGDVAGKGGIVDGLGGLAAGVGREKDERVFKFGQLGSRGWALEFAAQG